MVSASSLRNYMIDDPIIDILNKDYKEEKSLFITKILEEGILYETSIINQLRKKYKVVESNNIIDSIKEGVDIIYQPYLSYNNTYGYPDMIVKSSIVNDMLGYDFIKDIPYPNHYVVVDIKNCKINLLADKTHIVSNKRMNSIKAQLYVYTMALNKILCINTNIAYVLAPLYIYKDTVYNTFDMFATIDFNNNDKYIQPRIEKAIEWSMNQTDIVYPNMKNPDMMKTKSSLYSDCITSMYYCGYKNQMIAHSNNIYSWKDPRCTASLLGFKEGSKKHTIINRMLDINKSNDIIYCYGKNDTINDNIDSINFYLDIETTKDRVFMIGVGYYKRGNWSFRKFIMLKDNNTEEYNIWMQLFDYVNNISMDKNVKFYCWGNYEYTYYKKFTNKHSIVYPYTFIDLCKYMSENIVVKDCLNFKLKTIGPALYKYNLINTTWDITDVCSNGMDARMLAQDIYSNLKDSNPLDSNLYKNKTMKKIAIYNEKDCHVVHNIHILLQQLKLSF